MNKLSLHCGNAVTTAHIDRSFQDIKLNLLSETLTAEKVYILRKTNKNDNER